MKMEIPSLKGITEKQNYFITGITGFLGSLIAKSLMETDAYRCGNIHIYGIARNVNKAKDVFSQYDCRHIQFIEADICDRGAILSLANLDVDYVIHCAATTQSLEMVSFPVEVADGLVLGTKHILELARILNVQSMVMLSSMEVYGVVPCDEKKRNEQELGNVDIEKVRSCYPMGKRMAEHYCFLYHKEYGVPVKVARLAQVFGKGVRAEDNRVFMQFAKAAKEGRDIVLKTDGQSMGNYCDSLEAIDAIFTVLYKGKNGEVYNVVNEENTMTVFDMANLVAKEIAGGKIQVQIQEEDLEKTGYAPKSNLRLSGAKLRELGCKPTRKLWEMYRDI